MTDGMWCDTMNRRFYGYGKFFYHMMVKEVEEGKEKVGSMKQEVAQYNYILNFF